MKEPELAEAHELFAGTGVQITTEGRRLLGAPICTDDFCREFLQDQVSSWVRQLSVLASVARTQAHAISAAFKHAFVGRLIFLSRTCGRLQLFLPPLEKTIHTLFLPSFTGWLAPEDEIRTLLALPPCSGQVNSSGPSSSMHHLFAQEQGLCMTCRQMVDSMLMYTFLSACTTVDTVQHLTNCQRISSHDIPQNHS